MFAVKRAESLTTRKMHNMGRGVNLTHKSVGDALVETQVGMSMWPFFQRELTPFSPRSDSPILNCGRLHSCAYAAHRELFANEKWLNMVPNHTMSISDYVKRAVNARRRGQPGT